MTDMVPRKDLTAQAVKGVGGVGGAIALFVLQGLTAAGFLSIPGLIIGGILSALGLGIMKEPKDRLTGTVMAAAGIATVVASLPIIGGLGGFVLGGAAIVCAVFGGWNLFKFIKNMAEKKSRGY